MYNVAASIMGWLKVDPTAEDFNTITVGAAIDYSNMLRDLESKLVGSIDAIVSSSPDNSTIITRANKVINDEGLATDKLHSITQLDQFLREFRRAAAEIREVLADIVREGYGEQDVTTLLDLRDKVKDFIEESPDFSNELSGRVGEEQPLGKDDKRMLKKYPPYLRLPKDEKISEDPRRQGEDADSSGAMESFLEHKEQSGG